MGAGCRAQVGTWIDGFGFESMPDETLHRLRSSLRMLVFPGTSILHRPLQAAAIPCDPPPSLWTVRTSSIWPDCGTFTPFLPCLSPSLSCMPPCCHQGCLCGCSRSMLP